MILFSVFRPAAIIATLVFIASVVSTPTFDEGENDYAPDAITAPHFLIWSDKFVSGITPSVGKIAGYNVFALSFWMLSGPQDQALGWTQLTAAKRRSVKSAYHAAGISLIVSAFGSTDVPTSAGADPNSTAHKLATYVSQYNLDGVDVDYEDFNAFDKGDGSAEKWLITFTKALRSALPPGAILTHAPVAPWFQPGNRWRGGGYLKVHKSVGSLIDWYNIQFYNQGAKEYTTCTGLLTKSSSAWPKTSLFEIAASGVPQDKLSIGKPATKGDAANGYISPSALAGCVSQAKARGWKGGVSVWEFPDAASSWIRTVRGSSFPTTAGSHVKDGYLLELASSLGNWYRRISGLALYEDD